MLERYIKSRKILAPLIAIVLLPALAGCGTSEQSANAEAVRAMSSATTDVVPTTETLLLPFDDNTGMIQRRIDSIFETNANSSSFGFPEGCSFSLEALNMDGPGGTAIVAVLNEDQRAIGRIFVSVKQPNDPKYYEIDIFVIYEDGVADLVTHNNYRRWTRQVELEARQEVPKITRETLPELLEKAQSLFAGEAVGA